MTRPVRLQWREKTAAGHRVGFLRIGTKRWGLFCMIPLDLYPQASVGLSIPGLAIMATMGWPPEWPNRCRVDGVARVTAGFWSLSWWRTR